MTSIRPDTLIIAIGSYPHTAALRSGQVSSERLRLDFAEIAPISRAFAPLDQGLLPRQLSLDEVWQGLPLA